MLDYRSTLKLLAAFGGAVVAGYYLSASPPPTQNRAAVSPEPAVQSATNLLPAPPLYPHPSPEREAQPEPLPDQALVRRPVRIVPIERPDDPEATGPVRIELPQQQDGAQTVGRAKRSATPAAPKCDRDACSRAYRSFHEADCTYQPQRGPRKLCTRGDHASDAFAQSTKPASSPTCKPAACRRAFRSFDPATCTYKPLNGPRQRCKI